MALRAVLVPRSLLVTVRAIELTTPSIPLADVIDRFTLPFLSTVCQLSGSQLQDFAGVCTPAHCLRISLYQKQLYYVQGLEREQATVCTAPLIRARSVVQVYPGPPSAVLVTILSLCASQSPGRCVGSLGSCDSPENGGRCEICPRGRLVTSRFVDCFGHSRQGNPNPAAS